MKNSIFYWVVLFTLFTSLPINAQRTGDPTNETPTIIVRFELEHMPLESINEFRRRCESQFHISEIDQFQTCDEKLMFCLWEVPTDFILEAIGVINDQQGASGCFAPRPDNVTGQGTSDPTEPERVSLREAYAQLSDKLFGSINGEECDNRARGKQRIIQIIDSGLDNAGQMAVSGNSLFSHNTFMGKNYVDPNTQPKDKFWHGTHVAGIMEMLLDVHPASVQLGISKVLDENGKGKFFNLLHAIADNMCGTDVFNFSLTYQISKEDYPEPKDMLTDLMSYAGNHFGCLFVVGSGNDGQNFQDNTRPTFIMPAEAELENMIAVYAIDGNGGLSSFSNFGEQTQTLRIGAAGESVLSTSINGQWLTASGTSMAAPSVATVAGILATYQNSTKLDYQTIIDIINTSKEQTGERLPSGLPVEILNFCQAIKEIQSRQLSGRAAAPNLSRIVSTTLIASPNPSNGLVNLSFKATERAEAKLSVFDVRGNQLRTRHITVQNGQNNESVNLQELPTGLYQLVVYLGKETKTVRVLKQ